MTTVLSEINKYTVAAQKNHDELHWFPIHF